MLSVNARNDGIMVSAMLVCFVCSPLRSDGYRYRGPMQVTLCSPDSLCAADHCFVHRQCHLSSLSPRRSRGKKHSIILRTQLTVRVHACIGECSAVA